MMPVILKILIALGVVVVLGWIALTYFSNKVVKSWANYYTCPRCTDDFQGRGLWYEVCPNCGARLNLSGVRPHRKREEPRELTVLWNLDTNKIVVKNSKGKVIERKHVFDFKKSKYDNDILDFQISKSDDVL